MTSQTFVDLSRWQFATTAAFHMTFPALSVGLAIFLVICCSSAGGADEPEENWPARGRPREPGWWKCWTAGWRSPPTAPDRVRSPS